MKNKNIGDFNRKREPAHPSPRATSTIIPTIKKQPELKTESVEEFRLRSGEITRCKPKRAPKSRHTQGKPTRDQIHAIVRCTKPTTSSTLNTIPMRCVEILKPIRTTPYANDDAKQAA